MIPPGRLSFPGPHHDRESEEENTRERVSQHFIQYLELVGDPLRPPSVVPQMGSVASSTRILLHAQGAITAAGPEVPLPATEVAPGPVPYSQLVDLEAPYGTPFLGGCHLTRMGTFVTNRRGRTLPLFTGTNPFPWAVRAVNRAARRRWVMGANSARTFAAAKTSYAKRTGPLREAFHIWSSRCNRIGRLRPVNTPMPVRCVAESPAPTWSTGGLILDHEGS